MIRSWFFIFGTVLLLAFQSQAAGWQVIKANIKNKNFETSVALRTVKLGKTESLAAVMQNSRISSKLYPNFKKTTTDDIAKYLLKSYPQKYQKESLESVQLYRTENNLEYIRLMVKKRKNDFLISFALVKKPFLYRSYNETDLLQRIFIAEENKKIGDKKSASILKLLMNEAQAAGFSYDTQSLLDSFNNAKNKFDFSKLNDLVYASQQIAPSINALSTSVDRQGAGFTQAARGIESSINKLSDPKNQLLAGTGFGIGVGVGTMFSNVAVMAVSSAYTGIKNLFLDLLSLYRPGERDKLLAESNQAWADYENLQKEMYLYEKQLQDLELALQVASGKPLEQIFDLSDEKNLSKNPSLNGTGGVACRGSYTTEQLDQLKRIGLALQSDPNVKKQLCQKLDSIMDMIEDLSYQMNVTRALISKNILVAYNNIIENKQKALEGPDVINKAAKECRSLAEKRHEALQERYEAWKCDDQKNSQDCADLKSIMDGVSKRIQNCNQKSSDVMASYDSNYLSLAKSMENMQNKMDERMDDFLKSDCDSRDPKSYCQGQDGVMVKVKKAYNARLAQMKASQCPNLKTDRFGLKSDVLAGQLKTQADLNPVSTSNSRSPASVSSSQNENTPSGNIFSRMWNGFVGGLKSLLSWFH